VRGRGRCLSFQLRIVERPLDPSFSPHAGRRRSKRPRSRDAFSHPSCPHQSHECFCLQQIRGGGAPTGANCLEAASSLRMLPPACASDAARATQADVAIRLRFGRARLSALHRGSHVGFFRPDVATSGQVSCDLAVAARAASACPSPADAPRAPVVMPVDMMPEAARERFARSPAGTALAPRSGVPREHVPVHERDAYLATPRKWRVKDASKQICGGARKRLKQRR
jgi:hypothetical protein